MITIYSVGKKHESWVQDGIERYQKRLRKPWDISWRFFAHSSYSGNQARNEESERMLNSIDTTDHVILLDERGQPFDSPALSSHLAHAFSSGKNIIVIIGGAYGVDSTLTARANVVWSLSPLVFPHQLVRLILTEQIYRSQQIDIGSGYHHE